MSENQKLCSFCDEPAVRGGKTTAFCIEHFAEMVRFDERYGWKTADQAFERVHMKIRDVDFTHAKEKKEEENVH